MPLQQGDLYGVQGSLKRETKATSRSVSDIGGAGAGYMEEQPVPGSMIEGLRSDVGHLRREKELEACIVLSFSSAKSPVVK